MPAAPRRHEENPPQVSIMHGFAPDAFRQRGLFQAGARRLPAFARQLKFDGLRRQIPRRLIPAHALRYRHHRPDQTHGRQLFVRARHRRLPGCIYRSLRVCHEVGLRRPALSRSVGQFGAERDPLAWLQSQDANGCRFIQQYVIGLHLDRFAPIGCWYRPGPPGKSTSHCQYRPGGEA